MVVTASTAQGQSEKRASEIIERVFDGQVLRIVVDSRPESPGIRDIASGDQALLSLLFG